ncbi:hypothetical protein PSI22_07215 [Xenorhabdus sp. XENO-7]|uniref:Uncharacterized protein n=1 Tax=Xenorhabdus aichiensis TaxID=3025874 RepID=A0ABT5M385_9GAMM|nr:hypothetical protein [Xenorhabdus aichiensis]MDC9621433.1 hypothetical protein [Xenorhabdus aichiensis]
MEHMVTVSESGIEFGPFHRSNVFQIENVPYVKTLQGIKSCEFVLWRDEQRHLIFLEAKSSIPNNTKLPDEYNLFFANICEKFDNSVQLMTFASLNACSDIRESLSEIMRNIDWKDIKIHLYLVIPNAPDQFLSPLTDKARSVLKRQIKLWKAELFVINKRLAKDKHLHNTQ